MSDYPSNILFLPKRNQIFNTGKVKAKNTEQWKYYNV